MSNQDKAAQGSAAAAESSTKFSNMRALQKIAFIGKTCVFLLTMGFAYPNLFND